MPFLAPMARNRLGFTFSASTTIPEGEGALLLFVSALQHHCVEIYDLWRYINSIKFGYYFFIARGISDTEGEETK